MIMSVRLTRDNVGSTAGTAMLRKASMLSSPTKALPQSSRADANPSPLPPVAPGQHPPSMDSSEQLFASPMPGRNDAANHWEDGHVPNILVSPFPSSRGGMPGPHKEARTANKTRETGPPPRWQHSATPVGEPPIPEPTIQREPRTDNMSHLLVRMAPF